MASLSLASAPLHGQRTRLLHLHPGARTDQIVCELTVGDLEKVRGSYIAVSYTWGSEAALFPILLDGQVFAVRRNLYDLLTEFRLSDKILTLWIDAICIDQNSLQERNHQVNLMGKIFHGAAEVRAWLGVGSPKEHNAFTSIKQLAGFDPVNAQKRRQTRVSCWEEDVAAIAGNPYWTRSWIVQELVLAQDITIHCGSDSCHWNELLQLVSCVGKDHATIIREIANTQNDQGLTFSTLYRRFGEMNCTVVHDKFYSLYGMVDPSSVPPPDYSLCLTQVIMQQFACLQRKLILNRDKIWGTSFPNALEHYPLTFFNHVCDNIQPSRGTSTFCSCHSANMSVKVQVPLSGSVHQVEGQHSPPLFCIFRYDDIYRFRRFTSDVAAGDLAFHLSPTVVLVARISTNSSQAWVRPIRLVHFSSGTECHPPTLFKHASLEYRDKVLTVLMPIKDVLDLADFHLGSIGRGIAQPTLKRLAAKLSAEAESHRFMHLQPASRLLLEHDAAYEDAATLHGRSQKTST